MEYLKIEDIEVWLPVANYEELYQISNKGKVKSLLKNKILKECADKDMYLRCTLFKNGIGKTLKIHRLVAEAFLGNIEGFQINHKNGIRWDNRVENLEIVTSSENILHSYRVLGKKANSPNKGKFGKNNPLSKKVYQYDVSKNLIKVWDSISDVVRTLGFLQSAISHNIRGSQKTAYGFIWSFTIL